MAASAQVLVGLCPHVCIPPHDLRRVCQPHERGERLRESLGWGGEEGISIEFLLHGGAEHNSRGKASIAILNTRMARVDRSCGIEQAGKQCNRDMGRQACIRWELDASKMIIAVAKQRRL